MIPLCRERGCQVHKTPGPAQTACEASCKLSREDKSRPVPPPPVKVVTQPPKPVVAVPQPRVTKPTPPKPTKLHTGPKVHFGTGIFVDRLVQWRPRPPRPPPWEKAACGGLGVTTKNIADVTCVICLRCRGRKP